MTYLVNTFLVRKFFHIFEENHKNVKVYCKILQRKSFSTFHLKKKMSEKNRRQSPAVRVEKELD